MRKAPLLIAVILAAAFAGAVIAYRHWTARPPEPAAPPDVRPPGSRLAPPFALKDIDGNIVSSERFAGKPFVVNFFATWCPPCREEIPGFVEVYRKYRDRGFELVGISLDTDTRPNLPAFIASNRIDYRVVIGDIPTARSYGGVSSIPTTFFVGRDGEIKNVHVGYLDREAFEREVLKIL